MALMFVNVFECKSPYSRYLGTAVRDMETTYSSHTIFLTPLLRGCPGEKGFDVDILFSADVMSGYVSPFPSAAEGSFSNDG